MQNALEAYRAARAAAEQAWEDGEAALLAAIEAAGGEVADDAEPIQRIIYWDNNDDTNITDLEEMTTAKLKKFAKDNNITLTATDEEGIRDEIYYTYYPTEVDGEDAEGEADEGEAEPNFIVVVADENDNEVEIDLMEYTTVKALKDFAAMYQVEITAKKVDEIRQEIYDVLKSEAGEEDIEASYGLTEMSDEELAELLDGYNLAVTGNREALVDRIVRAMDDGTIPTS